MGKDQWNSWRRKALGSFQGKEINCSPFSFKKNHGGPQTTGILWEDQSPVGMFSIQFTRSEPETKAEEEKKQGSGEAVPLRSTEYHIEGKSKKREKESKWKMSGKMEASSPSPVKNRRWAHEKDLWFLARMSTLRLVFLLLCTLLEHDWIHFRKANHLVRYCWKKWTRTFLVCVIEFRISLYIFLQVSFSFSHLFFSQKHTSLMLLEQRAIFLKKLLLKSWRSSFFFSLKSLKRVCGDSFTFPVARFMPILTLQRHSPIYSGQNFWEQQVVRQRNGSGSLHGKVPHQENEHPRFPSPPACPLASDFFQKDLWWVFCPCSKIWTRLWFLPISVLISSVLHPHPATLLIRLSVFQKEPPRRIECFTATNSQPEPPTPSWFVRTLFSLFPWSKSWTRTARWFDVPHHNHWFFSSFRHPSFARWSTCFLQTPSVSSRDSSLFSLVCVLQREKALIRIL